QQFEASLVQPRDVPFDLGQPAVQAGLVSGDGKLPVDAADILALGNIQAGQIFGEVAPFWLVGEQVAILLQQLVHQVWVLDDGWHPALLFAVLPRPDAIILPPLASPALVPFCKSPVLTFSSCPLTSILRFSFRSP